MMSLTFGLFTQVSGSGPLGPLVMLTLLHQIELEIKQKTRENILKHSIEAIRLLVVH